MPDPVPGTRFQAPQGFPVVGLLVDANHTTIAVRFQPAPHRVNVIHGVWIDVLVECETCAWIHIGGIQTTSFCLLGSRGIQHANVGMLAQHSITNLLEIFCRQGFCEEILSDVG